MVAAQSQAMNNPLPIFHFTPLPEFEQTFRRKKYTKAFSYSYQQYTQIVFEQTFRCTKYTKAFFYSCQPNDQNVKHFLEIRLATNFSKV